MKTVLSTKRLTPSQKELLLNSDIGFVEYNALEFEFLHFEIPVDSSNLIFTSKNAVKAFIRNSNKSNFSKYKAYCVGDKTKFFLEENGVKVRKTAQNASELGEFIVKNGKNHHFFFFTGNLRRDELPELLKENNIRYKEIVAYNTNYRAKKFHRTFDAVLFFSPSGVHSYSLENNIEQNLAFCIGSTTSTEARKHTSQIIIANKPTVENVLVQVIKHFKHHD